MGLIKDLKVAVRFLTNSNASMVTGEIHDTSDTRQKGPLGFDSARTGYLKRLAANPTAPEFKAVVDKHPGLSTDAGRARALELSRLSDAGKPVTLASPAEKDLSNAVFLDAEFWTNPKANTAAKSQASARTTYLLAEYADIGEPGAWRAREASFAVDTGAATRAQVLANLPPDAKQLFLKAESKTGSQSSGWTPK